MKQKSQSKTNLLLLEDVRNLGRKGELAKAKPGFVRNYLLPQKKAVIADKRAIRMQERLKEERAEQAAHDKKEAEAFAVQLKEKTLTIVVKNDAQGHLYGSVGPAEIVKILAEQEKVTVERKNVLIAKPIKMVGVYDISLRLKENVPATFKLKVDGETKVQQVSSQVEAVEEGEEKAAAEGDEEATEDLPKRSEREKEMKEELEERAKE